MKKLLIYASLFFVFPVMAVNAQSRKSVGAAEVNGTFRSYFSGKYKGSYNEIKILALGGGKLRVAFQLLYPYTTADGELMANTGEADGTATITGDTAVYAFDEFGQQCRITIKFVKRGTIEVTQEGASECGFGLNVSAGGTYKKTNSAKPKFKRSDF